jgi:hypothetical protein
MAAYDVLSFDGVSLLPAAGYAAHIDAREEYGLSTAISTIDRRSASPLVSGLVRSGKPIVLYISRFGATLTAAQFRNNVKDIFDPYIDTGRLLVIEGDDGTTDVQIECYVESWSYISVGIDQYIIALWAPSGVWQKTTLTTSASNPATVTNAGNVAAAPTIELTTTNHVTRRACTVTPATAYGNLIAYPVVFALDSTAVTSSNTFVYVEGVSVPCYVDDAGLVTSRVWALIDTAVAGTATNVDIIYGTGLVNPLCQTLDDGGMDWADNTNCTNAQWEWNDWSGAASNPPRPGTWRAATTGNHSETADVSYQESAGIIYLGAAGSYGNGADSLRLSIPSGGLTLTNLSRQTANLDGANARAYVRKRTRGSATWSDVWTQTTNATVTTALGFGGNSVEITVGLENFGTTADPSTLTVTGSSVTLTIFNAPTVVVGSAENMDRYDGTYTIGSRSITFSDFIVPDGTLTIDCDARSISSSVAGPFYGDEDALTFSHPDQWLVLLPGSNTITDGLSATDVVKHRDTYG